MIYIISVKISGSKDAAGDFLNYTLSESKLITLDNSLYS